jgi:hypothetical protein
MLKEPPAFYILTFKSQSDNKLTKVILLFFKGYASEDSLTVGNCFSFSVGIGKQRLDRLSVHGPRSNRKFIQRANRLYKPQHLGKQYNVLITDNV